MIRIFLILLQRYSFNFFLQRKMESFYNILRIITTNYFYLRKITTYYYLLQHYPKLRKSTYNYIYS